MKCTILHESRGRMRVHVNAVRMTLHRADVLEAYLNHSEVIEHAKVYERTGDVLIQYKGSRAGAVTVLSHYKFDNPELDSLVTSADSRNQPGIPGTFCQLGGVPCVPQAVSACSGAGRYHGVQSN